MIVIKYAHESYVKIEETHDTRDWKFTARTTDSCGIGMGDTPLQAVLNLCESLREEAYQIQIAAEKQFGD